MSYSQLSQESSRARQLDTGLPFPEHITNVPAGLPVSGQPEPSEATGGRALGPGSEDLQGKHHQRGPKVTSESHGDSIPGVGSGLGGPVSPPLGAAASLPQRGEMEGGEGCTLWPYRDEHPPTWPPLAKLGATPSPFFLQHVVWLVITRVGQTECPVVRTQMGWRRCFLGKGTQMDLCVPIGQSGPGPGEGEACEAGMC